MEPFVREALARLLAIFRQCEVAVTGEVHEALIQELARDASRSGPSTVASTIEQIMLPGLIRTLLPDRWLAYDTERIYDPEDYALLTEPLPA